MFQKLSKRRFHLNQALFSLILMASKFVVEEKFCQELQRINVWKVIVDELLEQCFCG